ncbi:DapH/DapD/GlmU-related protein [Cohnella panacarvi]|uniref:DapH/DapD/GlmU-related protein n=1 Tax=Cohnella panacarvi TaxID=400776 RepID=UPI00047AA05D|nr:DapH/DapD/GlmU-related protein [Cohnella panacarvi]
MNILPDLINFQSFAWRSLFLEYQDPREILMNLGGYIEDQLHRLPKTNIVDVPGTFLQHDKVWIGENTTIEPGVYIKGPALIGSNVTIRHGAYLRENVIIGDNCVVGHCSEIKHSVLLNKAKAPHFNYIGNSIIGEGVNFGAGSICSNVKNLPFKGAISIEFNGHRWSAETPYFGSIVGDNAKIGCNTVLNPGTVIGKNVVTYANISLKCHIPDNHIVKSNAEIVPIV